MMHIVYINPYRREGNMSKKRQDSWTSDEDVILVETVLRYIRDGKTQLEAFKEAGKKLSRTAAACGFRWNATLRKKHLDDINVAKQTKRHHLTEIANNSVAIEEQTGEVSIEKAISL